MLADYGCLNDVQHVQHYLSDTCDRSRLHIETLLDSDATRRNVVHQIQTHLGKAGKDDVVVFHYSGHGARSRSASQFRQFFPDGWDEGLVCHDRQTADDFEVVVFRREWFLNSLGESPSHEVDQVVWQVGEVSEREVLYLAVFAVRVPKQVRDIGLALVMPGDGSDMNGALVGTHASMFRRAVQTRNPRYWRYILATGSWPTVNYVESRLSSQMARFWLRSEAGYQQTCALIAWKTGILGLDPKKS